MAIRCQEVVLLAASFHSIIITNCSTNDEINPMKAPADKSLDNQRQAAANEVPQQQASAETEYEFVDNREETAGLRQLQEVADNSPQAQGLAQLSAMMNNSSRSAAMQNLQAMVDISPRQVAQRVEDEEVLQAGSGMPVQREDKPTNNKGSYLSKKQTTNLNHPLGWITQLKNYPKDSTGTIIDFKYTLGQKNGEKKEIAGPDVQKIILEHVKIEGFEGGSRICSYDMDREGNLTRSPERAGEEEHGMDVLPDSHAGKIDNFVKVFVLSTLQAANQYQYIIENKEEIFKGHDVVVDVDCQFDRRGQVGFHKDSRGTTAFVNLTFNNEEEMQGTEYYEDKDGDSGLEAQLPDEVKKDVGERREEQIIKSKKQKRIIEGPTLPAHGRISFSDPNIYHSTPMMGRRESIKKGLDKNGMLEYLESIHAEFSLDFDKNKFEKMEKEELGDVCNEWETELYHGHNLEEASKQSEAKMASRAKRAKKRKRRLSMNIESGKTSQEFLDKQKQTPRTFIRTWVRFVPKK